MFIPTILGQGTDEQKAALLPRCNTLEVIGTYAQTELGHGTFVRGLETSATFLPEQDAFVVHSPTLTSTKWWPGGLGKTATHAVVMARLFVGGTDHGPHAFIVQLRDLATHACLPGVEVGDIGPKFGYNGVDNGFCRFDHVTIPRTAMLMKYAKASAEGWADGVVGEESRGPTCSCTQPSNPSGPARRHLRAAAPRQRQGLVLDHGLRARGHRAPGVALPRQGDRHRGALLRGAAADGARTRRARDAGARVPGAGAHSLGRSPRSSDRSPALPLA